MDRRRFIRAGGAAAAGLVAVPGAALGTIAPLRSGAQAGWLLRGALVLDGSGAPGRELDVRVEGGRITEVGAGLAEAGAEVMELRGMAVAPGFIDIHSHTDRSLLSDPTADSKVRQGVTTEVAGADGGSVAPRSEPRQADGEGEYQDLGGFFRLLETRGIGVNFASMVGAGTIRGVVVGADDRPATEAELARMVALVTEALAQGACGLSTGLEYTPGGFADLDELVALATPLRARGLPYASHMRNEDDQLLAAIEEAVNVGIQAGVPVQVSHLKAQGTRNWWKGEPALRVIEAAREGGVDIHYDRYPYVAYSTGLANLFPLWSRDGGTEAFRRRLEDPELAPRLEAEARGKVAELGSWDAVMVRSTGSSEHSWLVGRRLGEAAEERGADPYELLKRVMLEGGGGMVGFGMSEENTERFLAHPLGMVSSDGGAQRAEAGGSPHPRSYGTFPRVLGHYVRERGIMSLETAVRKMTALPAAKLRLSDRGRVARGMAADLVVFDPATVADRATFEAPHQHPVGVPHVMVNGVWAVRDGEVRGARSGAVLRPGS
ncbi:MAG TPA: D-aminoacylase [Longimicrobiales bacterium]|nr:D-aminoacylase [Longimicrobiales bacterium]